MEAQARQLMSSAKHGDRSAFDALVRLLELRALRVAQGLVGRREDALELSQETFLKVFRARDSYLESEAFLPWFHRILRNTCFSHLRKRSVKASGQGGQGEEEDLDTIAGLADDGPLPSRGAEGEELAQQFWRAFRALNGLDREILSLRHFQELSYKEIAYAMNCPEGTVMSRLFHARRRLREQLGPELAKDYALETGAASRPRREART